MILAGGALAAAACGDNPRDVGPDDATSDDASEFPNLFCCNANPDPCCSCDPDAAPSAECQAERTCVAEGGVVGNAFDPFRGCFPADASSAEASQDASSADAGPDDDVVVLTSCCNANPDPCCMCLDAAIDPTNCDQERVCEAQGGTWMGYLHSADGSVTVCAFHDGGPLDAGLDVDGHD
jgi:hypothetical protein